MSRTALVVAALLACTACPGPAIHVPGKTRKIDVVVKIAALNASEVNGIGSFTLDVVHDGAVSTQAPLNFSASSRTLAFLDAPPDLPTSGTLSLTLQAADLTGASLPIGGHSETVDLDADTGDVTLFALVGRIGAPTLLDEELASATASAASVGSGVLFTEGNALEWLDLALGRHCKSGDAGCNFGDAVTGAASPTSLDAFDARCPHRGAAVFVQAAHLAIFDPAGLDGDGAVTKLDDITAAPSASLFATHDCRVLILADTSVVDVDLSADPPQASTSAIDASVHVGHGGALAALGDALDERVLVGGTQGTPAAALDTALLVTPSSPAPQLCESDDATCNGSATPATHMQCARATPVAARIDDGSDETPTLIIGGDNCAGAPAELLVSEPDAPFTRFLSLGGATPATVRPSGAALHAFGANTVLLAGGLDTGGQPSDALETFTLADVDAAGGTASGSFTTLTSSVAARGAASLVEVGGALLLVGSSTKLEIIVPPVAAGGGG